MFPSGPPHVARATRGAHAAAGSRSCLVFRLPHWNSRIQRVPQRHFDTCGSASWRAAGRSARTARAQSNSLVDSPTQPLDQPLPQCEPRYNRLARARCACWPAFRHLDSTRRSHSTRRPALVSFPTRLLPGLYRHHLPTLLDPMKRDDSAGRYECAGRRLSSRRRGPQLLSFGQSRISIRWLGARRLAPRRHSRWS